MVDDLGDMLKATQTLKVEVSGYNYKPRENALVDGLDYQLTIKNHLSLELWE